MYCTHCGERVQDRPSCATCGRENAFRGVPEPPRFRVWEVPAAAHAAVAAATEPPVVTVAPPAAPPVEAPPRGARRVVASLVRLAANSQDDIFELRVGRTSVGTHGTDIVLDPKAARSLSAEHAAIEISEPVDGAGTATITDLGSTNGTFVDGIRVHGECALEDGCLVRLGHVDFLFSVVDRVLPPQPTVILASPVPAPPAPATQPPTRLPVRYGADPSGRNAVVMLKVLSGARWGETRRLAPGTWIIGSGHAAADVVFAEGLAPIAARHASIRITDAPAGLRLQFSPLDPEAETSVNGRRLGADEVAELLHRDRIRLGEIELLVIEIERPDGDDEEDRGSSSRRRPRPIF